MLRLGWVRLSDYGLKVAADGRVVPTELVAATFVDTTWEVPTILTPMAVAKPSPMLPSPVLAAPKKTPPPIPKLNGIAPRAPNPLSFDEDEREWQAAVAKAKANPPAPVTKATDEPVAAIIFEPKTEVAQQECEVEKVEDWERVIHTARARAAKLHTTHDFSSYEDTQVDPQAAQPRAAGSSNSLAKADDDVGPKQQHARKLRAIREIQRLEGRPALSESRPARVSAPPHQRRLAAGTSPVPSAGVPSRPLTRPEPRQAKARPPFVLASKRAKLDLPRVTQRLHR